MALGAVTMALALAGLAATAGPASAVFPGANGRLFADGHFFDPPSATPLAYPWTGLEQIRFSADDTLVAGVHGVGSGSPTSIWVADVDGSNAHQVTTNPYSNGDDMDPTWSPDGKEIAFVRTGCAGQANPASCPGASLTVVDLATGQTHDLIGPASGYVVGPPDWSPDPGNDELAVLLALTTGTTNDVDLVNAGTGALHNEASGTTLDYVRFAPDGNSLVTATQEFENDIPETISTIPLAGGPGLSFQVQTPDGVVYPTFTPDGQAITFADCMSSDCGIWNAVLPPGDAPPGTPPTFQQVIATPYSPYHLDWEPLINEPVITAGPSGRVRSDEATFEFSIPSQETGTYQCQLDHEGWQDGCTSPRDYPGLADGQHTFQVRFYTTGENPDDAPIASRSWTVDTTEPQALIDQSPSGSTDSTDATIVFHSTKPSGATFTCSEDGGPQYDCSSPQNLSGLAVGAHTFSVKAIDDLGNEQQSPTVVTWDVTEPSSGSGGGGSTGGGSTGGGSSGGGGSTGTLPSTPGSDCGGGRFTKVAVGAVVAIGRGTTCFVRTAKSDGTIAWSAAGPITINGVQVTSPAPIVLDQRLNAIDIQLPQDTTFGFGSFSWTLPIATTVPLTSGKAAHFLLQDPKAAFKVAGLEVAAEPDFSLSEADGGSATVSLELKLPSAFQGAAGEETEKEGAKGLTFAFKFIASNDKGVRFAFKAAVSGAWLFGKVRVTKLSVGLDQGPPLAFDGGATVQFPPSDTPFTISLGLSGQGDQPFPLVTKLALEASDLQKPIAEGVFLQRLGGGFRRCVGADKQSAGVLSATAGLSFGPKLTVPGIFTGEPASLDGTAKLSLCEPKSIELSGAGKIVEVPIGQASAKYIWSQGRIELKGNLDLTVGGWGFAASITKAFFDMPGETWDVEASAQLHAPSLFGVVLNGKGDAVLSSNGLAACFGRPGARYGIAKHWGQGLQTFDDSCDVGPYTAGGTTAHATAADGFAVAPGERLKVVAATGSGAPPKIALVGPGGERIDTPAGANAAGDSRALVIQDPRTATTHVVLFSPRPGRWSVTPEPGMAAPLSVRTANGQPPVSVSAHVAGSGARRSLSWSQNALTGQRVTFVELGGARPHTLLTTTRARGRLRFTSERWGGRARRIEALVSEHGLPRDQLVVARYRVPAPPRLRAVHGLHLHRATLRWPTQPAAAEYSVMLAAGDGATFATVTRHPSLLVPRSMRHGRLSVTLSALSSIGGVGPVRTVSVQFRTR